ncbi:MAG: hypothetical protein Q4F54_00280 [Coriobacteriia bacterium]|nr:hypothetical protein [Coriobacteriia bacterium]
MYTDPNSGEVQSTDPLVQEGGYLHEYWKKFHDEYQLGNAHYYTIGERPEGSTEYPGKGICDVYYDRASNYPYFVKYYRENTAQTG